MLMNDTKQKWTPSIGVTGSKWTPGSDISFYQHIGEEAASLYFREVKVMLIDRDKIEVDPMYGESKNLKYKSYNIRAQMVINPKKTELTKFGLDDVRDLVVNIPTALFDRGTGEEGQYTTLSGGFPVPEEGDLFILEQEEFKIMDITKIDYFWHTEKNLTFSFACLRRRPRAVDDANLVDENNIAGPKAVPRYSNNAFPGSENDNG